MIYYGEPFSDRRNRSLFNGKENVSSVPNGCMLDYGAREYDPVLARWTTPDPLADLYWNHSPYSYCLNNPVNYTDPSGCAVVDPLGSFRMKNVWYERTVGEFPYEGSIDTLVVVAKRIIGARYILDIPSLTDRYYGDFGTSIIGSGGIGGYGYGGGYGGGSFPEATPQQLIGATGDGLGVAGWWLGKQNVHLTPFKDSNVRKPKKPSMQKLKSATPAKSINIAKIGKGVGAASKALGGISILYTVNDFVQADTPGERWEASYDIVAASIGTFGGVWGLGISLALQYAVKPHINFDSFN